MIKKTVTTNWEIYSPEELSESEQQLVEHARQAMKRAYAPYSQFYVGAAVELADGTIIEGCNQENAAYGPTVCAERNALFAAGNLGRSEEVRKIALLGRPAEHLDTVTSVDKEKLGSPCGSCRQVLKEFEDQAGTKIVILCVSTADRIYRCEGIENYLPFAFGPKDLE